MRCCGIKVLHSRCYRSGAVCLVAPFCDPFAPHLLRLVMYVAAPQCEIPRLALFWSFDLQRDFTARNDVKFYPA